MQSVRDRDRRSRLTRLDVPLSDTTILLLDRAGEEVERYRISAVRGSTMAQTQAEFDLRLLGDAVLDAAVEGSPLIDAMLQDLAGAAGVRRRAAREHHATTSSRGLSLL